MGARPSVFENRWEVLPSDMRKVVRGLLNIRARARLASTCELNRREDAPEKPRWIRDTDGLEQRACRRLLGELDGAGLLGWGGLRWIFAGPDKPHVSMQEITFGPFFYVRTPVVMLEAVPMYRKMHRRWFHYPPWTPDYFRPIVDYHHCDVCYIEWTLTWIHDNERCSFGPWRSLRRLLDNMRRSPDFAPCLIANR